MKAKVTEVLQSEGIARYRDDPDFHDLINWVQETVSLSTYLCILPPANEVFEGFVFTGVCLSTGEWVSAPLHAGIHPPGPEADTPQADTPR